MKPLAFSFALFALLVGIKGADRPLVVPGMPIVLLRPCADIKPGVPGQCIAVVNPEDGTAFGIPIERVDGMRFVPDGQVM